MPGRRPSLDHYDSNINLLPVSSAVLSPSFEQPRAIHRKPVPSTQFDISNESYRLITASAEIRDAKESSGSLQGWPAHPRRLSKRTPWFAAVLVTEIIVTLLPMTFVVLGACALSLDKQTTSTYGSRIVDSAKLGPTVFPIIFAAIVGRLMRSMALWKAERGTNLGLLEQLTGSQSLAGAIERMVMLRRFGIIGTAIVLIWGLSPLGGQSSLRILDVVQAPVLNRQQLYYWNTSASETIFDGADDMDVSGPAVNALYSASLLAPANVERGAVDLWNNVKVPMLDALSPEAIVAEHNPWIFVNHTDNVTYSSLIGYMLAGVPSDGKSNFSMESSYLYMACSDGIKLDNTTQLNATLNGRVTIHTNNSFFYGQVPTLTGQAPNSFFVDTNSNLTGLNEPNDFLNIVYGSWGDCQDIWLYNCTVAASRVESNVLCDGQSCYVARMRRSEQDTRPSYITPFVGTSFYNMLAFFPWAAGIPHDCFASPTDRYLRGTTSPFEEQSDEVTDFQDVSGKVFEKRFSTLINTIWQASLEPSTIAVGATNNLTAYAAGQGNFPTNVTTSTVSRQVSIYSANHLWIAVLMSVTLVLQLLAILGMVLTYTTTAPDILGYVSTLTRDNPHAAVPEGGNTLDGLERARLLSDLRVQLADVKWDDDKGHIAFRSVDATDGFRLGKVSKRRLYL